MNQAEAKQEIGLVPDVRDVLHGAELRSFGHYVDKRMTLKAKIKEMEEEITAINGELTGILAVHDVTTGLMHGNYKCQIISKENKRLDKEKLLENGVSASIIAKSTVTTQSSYLDVREVKGKDV
jgi:hypothetical protein